MEFPVLHYTGVLKRWRKKSLLFVDEGFKLIDKSLPNNKSNDVIYVLKNAIILESIKNNKTLEISLRKGRIFIQAFSPKEKQIIKEKLRQHISKINETNIFSQEFEDYLSEINKQDEDNPSDDIFKSLQSTISLMINFFLELNQKIDDFKTLIDGSKLGKSIRTNFTECYNKLTFIESKMKGKFDELVKTLYDYHDLVESMMNDDAIKSLSESSNKGSNELDVRKRTSKSIKNIRAINLDSSDSENEICQQVDKSKKEKEEIKKDKEEKKEEDNALFKEDPLYNFEKRTKLSKKIEVNKNMIPEIVKLISSGQKVLPIQFNEPLNTLQRECERFIFCELLNKASEEKTPEMKMAYITAFLTAEMSMSIGRVLKPMIPLVGETFEYVDNKLHYRFFGEEVQRLPSHVSAYIVEGDKWRYWADNRNTTSFRFFAGAYAVDFGNKIHVELLNPNKKKGDKKKFDTFIYNRPSTLLKGILTNNLHYDYNGSVTMTSPDYPNITCTVEYVSDNYEEGIIKGSINKGEENIIYNIGGNWKKEIYITDENEENKKVLFTVKEEDFFKNSVDGYIIPQYSCNLNYMTDKLKEVLPKTDTRFRPDQKEYEGGSTEKSQGIKKTIEEMQVYKQELLDKSKKEYMPTYFENEYNEESKDFVFMYKGGYWEDRAKKKYKLKDIFDTTEFEKERIKRQKEAEKNENKK
jgi:hypothetical protein